MNIQELKNKLTLIASEEDDKEHFHRKYKKVGMAFKEVYNGGDIFVHQAGIYFLINDCGVQSLYEKKNLNQLELNLK